VFSLRFALIWHFGEAMGLKGQKGLLFWCLMPGGESKAKATGSANHLWISKIVELDFLCLIKTLLFAKIVLLWERKLSMGKGGVFGIWSNLLLKDPLICQNKCVWH
jgi:hypothetical protein